MACLDHSTLAAFCEGLLSDQDLAALDDHIAGCPPCYDLAASVTRGQAQPSSPGLGPSSLVEAAASELTTGDRVGRYLVTGVVGIGGMGVVYAALDPELERTVAIKLLRRDVGHGASGEQLRLVREAQAMARLAHPNVVAVFDAGYVGDRVFIAMELVRGRSLRRWLEEAPRTWREVLGVLLEAGRGLAASHRAGIVHGDFKPENVLVGDDGRVLVTDFGLARILAAPDVELRPTETLADPSALHPSLTRAGVLRGTPRYMAPEQLRGQPADASSDQFAFSAVLYEALHGERPFGGNSVAAPASELEAGPRPTAARRRVPGRIQRAVARGLRHHPGERYTSVDHQLRALEHRARPWGTQAALAASILVLVVGAGLSWRSSTEQRRQRCRGYDAELAAVWSPGRATELRRALAATGEPIAGPTAQSVITLLDRYGDAWRAQGRAACEAARVTGEQTEAILTLRGGCLASRKRDLQAVVDHLIRRADARLVARAVDLASSLPALAACADVAALEDVVPPPDDPARGATITRVRDGLAEARALVDAGELTEARGALDRLLEVARRVGYRPLEGAVLHELGRAQGGLGDVGAATRTLREAALALTAGRDDRGAFEARAQLVRLSATYRVGDRELAAAQVEEAAALLDRLGNPPELVPLLLESQALIARWRGDAESAVTLLRQAVLLLAGRDAGVESVDALDARTALGNALMALERFPEAVDELGSALEAARELRGRESPTAIGALTNLAAASFGLGETGAMEHALDLQREAVALRTAQLGPDAPPVLWDRLMAAWYQVYLGRHAAAAAELEVLEPPIRRLPGEYAVYLEQLLQIKGSLLVYDGRPRDALPAFRELQVMSELLAQTQVVPIALECMGHVLLELGRPAEARVPLERALRLFANLPSYRPSNVADTKGALARALAALGDDRARATRLAAEARLVLARDGLVTAWDLARLDRTFPPVRGDAAP